MFLTIAAWWLCLGLTLAQRTVVGTVTGADGNPLIGATVKAKGTNQGTVTNVSGKYSLTVNEGVTALVFSYTGFKTQEVALGAQNVVDVELNEGTILEEAVVVG